MSLIGQLLTEHRETPLEQHTREFMTGEDISEPTGYINENTALSLTAVYSCVDIKACSYAMLPLHVYHSLIDGGSKVAIDHPLNKIISKKPNSRQTSYQWRYLMSVHKDLWGAGISEIEFDERTGLPVAIWPIPPWRVTPKSADSGNIYYEVDLGLGKKKTLTSGQVLVFRSLSTSSFEWMSPIGVHRETLSAAMSVKTFGKNVFDQGTNPAGIIYHPDSIDEDSEESLKKKMSGYKGLGQAHRVMLLDSGMKWEKVGLPAQDAQYLETRRYDVSEIARIFKVPLVMLHDHEKQTSWGTGIEEQKDGFVTFTIQPDVTQLEQEMDSKLVDEPYFIKFTLEGLLRGKYSDRIEGYVKSISSGQMCPDEARALENKNPIPGGLGKKFYMMSNVQPLDSVNREIKEDKKPDTNIDKE